MMSDGMPPGMRERSRERSTLPPGIPPSSREPSIKASPACSDHTVSESKVNSRMISAPPKFRAKNRPQVSGVTDRDRIENSSPTQSMSVSINNQRAPPPAPRFHSPPSKQEPRQYDGPGRDRHSPEQHRGRDDRHSPLQYQQQHSGRDGPDRHNTYHDVQEHRSRPAQSDARSGSVVQVAGPSRPRAASHPPNQEHMKREPHVQDDSYKNSSARPAAFGAMSQDHPAPSGSVVHTAGPSGMCLEGFRAEKEEKKVDVSTRRAKCTEHLSSKEVEAYAKMHEENYEYMGEYHPSKKDTSHTEIYIKKRGAVSGDVLERGCRLIEKRRFGVKAAAHKVGAIIGELRDYWNKVYKHNVDDIDDSDSDSEEIGAVPAAGNSGDDSDEELGSDSE